MRALRLRSPVILGLTLAGIAVVLGYVGYRSSSGLGLSRSDALFSAIQLFVLEAAAPDSPTPWTLNVARFTAPFALAFATVVAVAALLRDQLQALSVKLFARDHVVMIGLARSGDLTAEALSDAKHQVVIVESDAEHERFDNLRAQGAKVIVGDATVQATLNRAATRRARHVIVTTSDDSRNLEIIERVSEVLATREGGRRTIVHVAIDDLGLWRALGRLHTAPVGAGTLFEFYNVADRAAQALLTEVRYRGGDMTHLRLHGDGPLLHRVLSHVVRTAALSGARPRVHVTTDTDDLRHVLDEEPWILEEADLVSDGSPTLHDGAPTALICSSGDDAAAIANALTLAANVERRNVFVAAATQQTGGFLNAVGVADKVHVIPAGFLAMGEDFLRQSGPELMAHTRHEEYLAQERAKGAIGRIQPVPRPLGVATREPSRVESTLRGVCRTRRQSGGLPIGAPAKPEARGIPVHRSTARAAGCR